MPLIKINSSLIYFSHIPKCAGSSVLLHLEKNGATVAFNDRAYFRNKTKWSSTSPQHIEEKIATSLRIPEIVDFSFTFVRNPLARFISAYNWNVKNGLIKFWITPRTILKQIEKADDNWHYKYDNHFRPMSNFISQNIEVYKVEDDYAILLEKINKLSNSNISSIIPKSNVRKEIKFNSYFSKSYLIYLTKKGIKELNQSDIELVKKVYSDDFANFKY
jgi:hypothetical protein